MDDAVIDITIDPTAVLPTIKKMLGLPVDSATFNTDLMLHVNSAIASLYQMGVIAAMYTVTSDSDRYEDIAPSADSHVLANIASYIYIKTKLNFDISTATSAVIQSLKEELAQVEWRLSITTHPAGLFG